MKQILNFFIATTVLTLVACETPTDNSIEEARQCSDKVAAVALTNPSTATATQASACITMLGSANTAEANQIKFGDILIEDGILGNIAQAATNQSSKAGNVDGINSMLLVLVDPVTTDVPLLTAAASGANSQGMVYVASLISMATTLNTLSTLTSPTNVQATISTCAGNPSCAASVQSSFNTMAASACSSSGDATLCAKATAISTAAGPNPTAAALVGALATYAATAH